MIAPSPESVPVQQAFRVLRGHTEGYDPYDLLLSPVLRSLRHLHPWLGIAAVQFGVRFPVSVRRALLVPRKSNAKTLALYIRGCLALYRARGDASFADEARESLRSLAGRRSPHERGYACWGYEFPWQSRILYLPPGAPSGVCTVFVLHALVDACETLEEPEHLELARSACEFLLRDLPRHHEADSLCFSYIPDHFVPVHNANLLVAAALSRVYAKTGERELIEPVEGAVRFSLGDQNPDGSWYYDAPPNRKRLMIDNYHTLFVLEALQCIREWMGLEYEESVARGARFWREHLVDADGSPRRYAGNKYPVDIRDVAQSLIWLADPRLGRDPRLFRAMLGWAQRSMLHPQGYYIFQRRPSLALSNRHYYPRMQAWMFWALARAEELGGKEDGHVPGQSENLD